MKTYTIVATYFRSTDTLVVARNIPEKFIFCILESLNDSAKPQGSGIENFVKIEEMLTK